MSESTREDRRSMEPVDVLMQMIMGPWVAQSLGVMARLGVADQLEAGPRTAEALAGALDVHAPSLRRMMSALASVGVFAQPQPGTFALTPLSDLLRSHSERSLRWMAATQSDPHHWLPWGRADRTIATGTPQTEPALGMPIWEHLERHPVEAERFGRAMSNMSATSVGPIAAAHDFRRYRQIVDVGGGHGMLLATAVEAAGPDARGLLFDLPGVIESARHKVPAGLADRIEFQGGSFFENIPAGGDAYLLKHILHDWNDERARQILACCRRAMSQTARLLVCEMVLSESSPPFTHWLDVHMMVLLDGMERSEEQFRQLFASAGFALERITPTQSPYCVIEGRPV